MREGVISVNNADGQNAINKEGDEMSDVIYTHKDGYHGIIHYRFREYWVDETHDIEEIKGKWTISVQVPGVNHKPQIFTIAVNGYDTEPDNQDLNDKRPALFYSEAEAEAWANEMGFPQGTLKIVEIKPEVANHNLFHEMGAYLIKKSTIKIPRRKVDVLRAFDEKAERTTERQKIRNGEKWKI